MHLKLIKLATVAIAVLHTQNKKQPFTIVGSGFCIDPAGLVVTCEHVLSVFFSKAIREQFQSIGKDQEGKSLPLDWASVIRPYAVFYDASHNTQVRAILCPVDLISAMQNFDLGIVRIPKHDHFASGFPHVEIEDYSNLSEGDEIGTCGFPLGNYLYEQLGTVTSSFSKGIISSIIPAPGSRIDLLRGFQLNLTATHGNSGGPVYSLKTGKVFGVLQRGVSDQAGRLVSGLVKAEPIYPLIEPAELQRMKSAPSGGLPKFG